MSSTYKCTLCKQEKDISCFHKNTTRKSGLQSRCKDCQKITGKEWFKNNPEKIKEYDKRRYPKHEGWRRQRRYGISPEEFEKKFESQGRKCAICKSVDPGWKNWCLDHNHVTGENRGILCNGCNAAVGFSRESEIILLSIIDYLRSYSKVLVAGV